MEARAINRYINTSPRKMRLVIDLIRGKSVDEALHILHFSPKHASKTAEKVLRSAVANLQNKDEGGRLEAEDIVVKTAFVDCGMTMKRISPAPMGRGFRIRKRSNHVTIVVASKVDGAARRTAKSPKAAKSKAAGSPEAPARKTRRAAGPAKKAEKEKAASPSK
jgi:large subunit ribosomal protein L22